MNLKELLKGSKLRNRFLVLFSTLAVVPVLVLGVTALYLVDISHKHDVSQMELLLVGQKVDEVDKFFAETLDQLNLFIGEEVPENFSGRIAPAQQEFFIQGLLDSNSAFEEVSFVELDGRISKTKGRRGEIETNVAYIEKQDRFTEAIAQGEYIGDVRYKEGAPTVIISALLHDRNNTPIHVLTAKINLAQIVSSIEKAGLGNAGYLVLTDSAGRLIAEGSPTDTSNGEDLVHIESIRRVLAQRFTNGLSEEDRYVSPLSNTEVITAGKIIPLTGWAMVVEWPTHDADSIIRDVRNRVALFTLATLLAVMVIAPFAASRLINPIRKLGEAANAIEKGKFDTKVNIKTGDELEDLGNTFNKMTAGLKRLEELKDEFVFVATHELRSPVTVIKGYLSMLNEGDAGELPDTAKDMINKANMANQRLAQLVNDLLEVARSEAGRIEIDVEPIDITKPISSSIEELRSLADQKSIKLTYENHTNIPQVMAEESRIKEVVVNLAGNAIKYTQEGGWVKVWHEVSNGKVTTHIQDNGFGISKEAQKKLFQKFYRVKTDKTKTITGTGLGLFIVKQIVEKMNGKIWVESEEGSGSMFSFSLQSVK